MIKISVTDPEFVKQQRVDGTVEGYIKHIITELQNSLDEDEITYDEIADCLCVKKHEAKGIINGDYDAMIYKDDFHLKSISCLEAKLDKTLFEIPKFKET